MAYIFYVQMDIPASHEAEFNRVYENASPSMRQELIALSTRQNVVR